MLAWVLLVLAPAGSALRVQQDAQDALASPPSVPTNAMIRDLVTRTIDLGGGTESSPDPFSPYFSKALDSKIYDAMINVPETYTELKAEAAKIADCAKAF